MPWPAIAKRDTCRLVPLDAELRRVLRVRPPRPRAGEHVGHVIRCVNQPPIELGPARLQHGITSCLFAVDPELGVAHGGDVGRGADGGAG